MCSVSSARMRVGASGMGWMATVLPSTLLAEPLRENDWLPAGAGDAAPANRAQLVGSVHWWGWDASMQCSWQHIMHQPVSVKWSVLGL